MKCKFYVNVADCIKCYYENPFPCNFFTNIFGGIHMDYLRNVEFWDWLMWVKEVTEKEWLEASDESRAALYQEFKQANRPPTRTGR